MAEEPMRARGPIPEVEIPGAFPDLGRARRLGFPEVILAERKTPEEVAAIAARLLAADPRLLVTRARAEHFDALVRVVPAAEWHERAGVIVAGRESVRPAGRVNVVFAGTSDLPVAEEAALTAEMGGAEVLRIGDVGVAGLHRLLGRIEDLRGASAHVVVAGMEGALPSVLGGLLAEPVIAVPTSVGYGAAFGGLAAVLGMLNSCAPGVTVVNIDNGFGAGYAAARINARLHGWGAATKEGPE